MTDSMTQYPGTLPSNVVAHRRTNEFNERTLPAGLRRDHATKPGTWALIHVLEGQLRYCVPSWNYDEVLKPGTPGIIAPEVLHFVEPQGAVRMFIEFYGPSE